MLIRSLCFQRRNEHPATCSAEPEPEPGLELVALQSSVQPAASPIDYDDQDHLDDVHSRQRASDVERRLPSGYVEATRGRRCFLFWSFSFPSIPFNCLDYGR
jgi:hypothetical protein